MPKQIIRPQTSPKTARCITTNEGRFVNLQDLQASLLNDDVVAATLQAFVNCRNENLTPYMAMRSSIAYFLMETCLTDSQVEDIQRAAGLTPT